MSYIKFNFILLPKQNIDQYTIVILTNYLNREYFKKLNMYKKCIQRNVT